MDKREPGQDDLNHLKARNQYLERTNRWYFFALELLSTLGDLHRGTGLGEEPSHYFRTVRKYLRWLAEFQTLSFYLVKEPTMEFELVDCHPVEDTEGIRQEVAHQIDRGTFAWALRQNRPLSVTDRQDRKQLVLHPLVTRNRVVGMFVARSRHDLQKVPAKQFTFLSILLNNLSFAIENGLLFKKIVERNRLLEHAMARSGAEKTEASSSRNIRDEAANDIGQELWGTRVRLNTLMGSIPQGIVIIDGNGTIETCNPAAEKIFGFQPEELIGQAVTALMPEPYRTEHASYLKKYFDTGTSRIIGMERQVQGMHKDGTLLDLKLTINEMFVGGGWRFLGVFDPVRT